MTTDKKMFCVVGVPLIKDIRRYALNIETKLNELQALGYIVQMIEQKNGMLLSGVRPIEHGAFRVEDVLAKTDSSGDMNDVVGNTRGFSAHSYALFHAFLGAVPSGTSTDTPEVFRTAVQDRVPALLKPYTSEQLLSAVEEFERAAKAHEQHHGEASTCKFPGVLREMAALVKQAVTAQLQ